MTNYYENLDGILFTYRTNYMNKYNEGDYVTATRWLYAMNCAHPSKAFLKDMPRFQMRSNSLRAKLDLQGKARRYCDYWIDLLEIAMADFREKNQADYNRV